ncbi:mandelate racemase/muconate lactonizing enzyme family protein [Frigidibacter sp. ROC022]|uniref:mandelate racemase/muconate lactonizing enzyme family protein n=1 Tax=Frigidibacter sp. ROC022 TaxID=2971796 RepID=UPI00215A3EFA|nr:mandelate racemase/muconate lactonizing enzyme family protein [Frigidibacter sp. ROC022]MCR8723506.1 mandelate racemase/muconate lactonizing enzyme family protein [Frigidibacter sp. ROC022]
MKITGIRTFLMHVGQPAAPTYATDGPKTQAFGAEGKLNGFRNWLFVKVETDEGITGIGECSGWPRVLQTAVEDLAHIVIGEDPMHIEKLWQKMQVAIMGHGMTGTVGGGAMTGIDMALWDIKGKALGVPVWQLLGGKIRDRVRIYTHANTAEVARSAQARGFSAIKCGGVSDPVRKVAELRDAVGADVDIAIDLHGPPWLTPADAARLARALEPYDLMWIEDPIAPENLSGYRRIRDAAHVPLAAGERSATIFGQRELIEEELVDVVQPDTGRGGGLTQMKKIAAMAEAHYIMMAPHSGSLGPVAEYAALHLLATIPNGLILERLEDDWPERRNIIRPYPEQTDGFLTVPDAPGLGCDIDEALVARYPSQGNTGIPAEAGNRSWVPGTWSEHLYVQTRTGRQRYFSGKDQE